MTNQEAIDVLQEKISPCVAGKWKEAVDVAISALQLQYSETRKNCDTCKHDPPSKKWPCVDCDMREPADRWEPQDVPDTNDGKVADGDLISRKAAIEAVLLFTVEYCGAAFDENTQIGLKQCLDGLPSVQPEIVRCKDCKYYSPMNRETKTGICNLIMHQNFGDNWFCAAAERKTDD